MEEIEVPLEATQEHMQHHALHNDGGSKLINIGALLSAVFAVFAAICALLAGHFSNEAMIEQIKSSDQWSYYQAKGIKSSLQEFRLENSEGKIDPSKQQAIKDKIERYKSEQEKISEIAKEKEHESEHLIHLHERLAMAVTFFQVAIAIIAIGVLTRKKFFFFIGSSSGVVGIICFLSFLFI